MNDRKMIRVGLEVAHPSGAYQRNFIETDVIPRTGEYVQLDGKGLQVFKVEAVWNQLGNRTVMLSCSIQSDFDPASDPGVWWRKS